jgi:hypothetical protein
MSPYFAMTSFIDDRGFGIEELADLFGAGLGGHEVAEDLRHC